MEENLEHSDWMKGIKETGFTAPSNYFDQLNESIQAKLVTERLKTAVPTTGFTIPANYLERLQEEILTKTTGETARTEKPKIVRLWRSDLLKYASAACFVIVAGAGIYFNDNEPVVKANTNYTDAATEQLLFDIDEDVIIEHIESNFKNEQKPSASEAALESYILNNYSQNDLTGNL